MSLLNEELFLVTQSYGYAARDSYRPFCRRRRLLLLLLLRRAGGGRVLRVGSRKGAETLCSRSFPICLCLCVPDLIRREQGDLGVVTQLCADCVPLNLSNSPPQRQGLRKQRFLSGSSSADLTIEVTYNIG